MKAHHFFAALVSIVLVGGCGSNSNSAWDDSKLEVEKAACSVTFMKNRRSMTEAQAEAYCTCMFDVVKVRWTYESFQNEAHSIVETLHTEGEAQRCLDVAVVRESIELLSGAAEDDYSQWASKWVSRCGRVLSQSKPNPIDHEICKCGLRHGAEPAVEPDRYRDDLTECLKEWFPTEE